MGLKINILTVSDTRTPDNDTSGDLLKAALTASGHTLLDRCIVKDDIYLIREIISKWVADQAVQVVLVTGGTGFTARDNTPQAVQPLFDTDILGFGELFRQISYQEIGSSTVQSRALAGLANNTAIFCMPGSNNACQTAWDKILKEQLDESHKPCNFVAKVS